MTLRARPAWPALLLLVLLPFWALPAGPARAHASLVETVPADGGTLDAAPAAIVLRFDGAVTPLALHLLGPGGAVELPGPAVAEGNVLRAPLPAELGRGTFLASWRVVSADGHPIGGTLAFGIGAAPVRAAAPEAAADPGWTMAAEALRLLLYAGFAVGAGAALFRALVAEPSGRLRRGGAVAALLGLLAALLGLGVQGGALLAADFPGALLGIAPWRAALGSTALPRALLLALGLALTAASLASGRRGARWVGLLGAGAAAVGFSLSGHAAAGGVATQLLLAGHVLCAAFWLGAFCPLLAALRAQGGAAAPVVRRFAALAIPAVAILLLSGTVQAAVNLPAPAALLDTGYGRLVLAKAATALVLLGLAAVNHLRLTPALATSGPVPLRRSIRAEAGLGAVALALTAVLSMTSPHPGTGAAVAGAPGGDLLGPGLVVAAEAQGLDLLLEAYPARVGQNRLTLQLSAANGEPVAAPEVWVTLSQPEAGIVGIRRRMRAEAPGRFVQEGPELAVAGWWNAQLDVLVNDFEQATASVSFDVPGPD
ncbi:copper resistance CopC/CopD family protein [Roseomonas sp. BN140053]|uniref:copper resistance CopC/CopD family protein n=1 Tax=Roseomonas sp. BN140053 TaxID=3391898 RepID=UPI0039EB433F